MTKTIVNLLVVSLMVMSVSFPYAKTKPTRRVFSNEAIRDK